MNSANFHEYLRNPSMLHQVNYQELKSLVLQYPYSTNLRYLMLVKSLLDGKRDYDKNLTLASLSSIDRKRLRQLVAQYSHLSESHDNYSITEDFLELKDLNSLEEVLDAGPAVDQQEAASLPLTGNGLEFLDDLNDTADVIEPTTETASADPMPDLENLETATTPSQDDTKSDGLDELFTMDRPLVNRQPEETADIEEMLVDKVAENETEEEEHLEIEESAEGLFDAPLIETVPPTTAPDDAPALETLENIPTLAETSPHATAEVEQASSIDELPEAADVNEPATKQETPDAIEDIEPAPTPKTNFDSYKEQIRKNRPGLLSGGITQLPKKDKIATKVAPPSLEEPYEEPDDVAKEVAAKSVDEDQTIATETLAAILARQGHKEKAIKMYEKLSLQYPEKSSTFAAQIKKLNKK